MEGSGAQDLSSRATVSAAATATAASSTDGPKTKPKKPMNAFLLFCKHHRALVKEKYPTLENRMITKILGEWWNELKGTEDQATYKNLASRYQDFLRMQQAEKLQQLQRAGEKTLAAAAPTAPAVAAGAAAAAAAPVTARQSGSSSPEEAPSSPSGAVKRPLDAAAAAATGAPKHFKKRYLAEYKLTSDERSPSSSSPPSPPSSDSRGSTTTSASQGAVSNPEEKACEALLQLASEGRLHVPSGSKAATAAVGNAVAATPPTTAATAAAAAATAVNGNASRSGSNSRSGTSSPKETSSDTTSGGVLKALPDAESVRSAARDTYPGVRLQVWDKIVKSLKHQTTEDERSKLNALNSGGGDVAVNLTTTTMTKLHTTTIIEHVIENIMDKGTTSNGKHSGLNNNAVLQVDVEADEDRTKEDILESLRKAARSNAQAKLNLSDQWRGTPQPHRVTPVTTVAQQQQQQQPKPPPPPPLKTTVPEVQLPQQPVVTASSNSSQLQQPPLVLTTALSIGVGNSLTVTKINTSQPAAAADTDQPLNLSTTPPQTPGLASPVTGEDKAQRACKGRRYQEFKDAAGIGGSRKARRQKSGSGGEASETAAATLAPSAAALIRPLINTQQLTIIPASPATVSLVTSAPPPTSIVTAPAVFDVNKELQNIPVRNFEAFAQKKKAGVAAPAAVSYVPVTATVLPSGVTAFKKTAPVQHHQQPVHVQPSAAAVVAASAVTPVIVTAGRADS